MRWAKFWQSNRLYILLAIAVVLFIAVYLLTPDPGEYLPSVRLGRPATTPFLPGPPEQKRLTDDPLEAISAGNAGRVSQLARLGEGKLLDVAYAPTGQLLAVATSAGIGLYDAETLVLERFIETEAELTGVIFAPDGATLASTNPVQVWRVADGRLLHTLKGSSVAFSPDGSLLASGERNEVWLWRSGDWELLRTLKAQKGGVKSLAFSPGGTMLAAGSIGLYGDESVQLWRVSDGTLLRVLEGHTDTVLDVAFSPSGETLATGSYDRTVCLWQVAGCVEQVEGCGRLLHTLKNPRSYLPGVGASHVHSVAFSPDGATLASGSADGQVRLWQVARGKLLHTFKGDAAMVTGVAFSPNGETLAAGSRPHWLYGGKGQIRLWRTSDRALLRTREIHMGVVSDVAFSYDGTLLAGTGQWDGVIRLWRVSDGTLLGEMSPKPTQSEGASSCAFSPDGQWLASVSAGRVLLWRASDGVLLDDTGSLGPVHSVAFSPLTSSEGALLAAGVKNNLVLWRIVEGRLARLRELKGHTSFVQSVAFSADGALLASSAHDDFFTKTEDYTVRVWRVSDGTLLHTLPVGKDLGDMNSVAFSPGPAGLPGDTLLAAGVGNSIWLWHVDYGTLLHKLEGHKSTVYSLAFASDGTVLASGAWDGTVRLWRVYDGVLLRTLDRHTDYVNSVAFSPDDAWLASGSYDGTVRLWGSATTAAQALPTSTSSPQP